MDNRIESKTTASSRFPSKVGSPSDGMAASCPSRDENMTGGYKSPLLRRSNQFKAEDIPVTPDGGHGHVTFKWWARGEWVYGQDSDDSRSKPSDKASDSTSLESLIDRMVDLDLTESSAKMTDYFNQKKPKVHRGVMKPHIKTKVTKDSAQSAKITDFFKKTTKKSNK